MSENPTPSCSLDAPSACRERVIEAACKAFMTDGFRGASVDRIAAAAGVAKQTLYNHFPSKDELFAETIRTGVRSILVSLDVTAGDLRTRLLAFGRAMRNALLSPEGLAWFRNIVAEAPRLPELGRIAFAEGPKQAAILLSRFIAAAMDRGELRRDDPVFAAEMLQSMLLNLDRSRGLFTADQTHLDDPIRVERIIDTFLRAYATRGPEAE